MGPALACDVPRPEMPYFDQVFQRLSAGGGEIVTALGTRHAHWGDYAEPKATDDSLQAFCTATEALTRRVCDAGGPIEPGSRVLDVGCGFGGTVASINERVTRTELVGLNIDDRQVARARELVQARSENQVSFVHGDACDLPFEAASFDRVLAVECIFHFPSRTRFFAEAARVLRPGGRLTVCDFVPFGPTLPLLIVFVLLFGNAISKFFGHGNPAPCTKMMYGMLARKTGFRLEVDEDITRNTLPTYPALRRMLREVGLSSSERSTRYFEWTARARLIRYRVLSFVRV
jgi:ubiquinone/menaquinone biosynthesis C-methylase UbiE